MWFGKRIALGGAKNSKFFLELGKKSLNNKIADN
jgi:hypothetical protein